MNGRQVHQLGRYLIDLSRLISLEPGDQLPTAGEAAVLREAFENPGSSIREITERTGFVQSYVSSCVTRLADQALLYTEVDAADRRRTLVHPTDMLVKAIARRMSRGVDDALRGELGNPELAARATVLLTELAAILLPAAAAEAVPSVPGPR